jgi:hypothetical protein
MGADRSAGLDACVHDDPYMRKELIESFPGTAKDCFSEPNGYTPVPRAGGAL